MKKRNLKYCFLALLVAVALLETRAQAGGQCSKGSVCGVDLIEQKMRVDQERASSKMKAFTAEQRLKERLLPNNTVPVEDHSTALKIHDDHKVVVKKWVSVHYPQLKTSSPAFNQKVEDEMEVDAPRVLESDSYEKP